MKKLIQLLRFVFIQKKSERVDAGERALLRNPLSLFLIRIISHMKGYFHYVTELNKYDKRYAPDYSRNQFPSFYRLYAHNIIMIIIITTLIIIITMKLIHCFSLIKLANLVPAEMR